VQTSVGKSAMSQKRQALRSSEINNNGALPMQRRRDVRWLGLNR